MSNIIDRFFSVEHMLGKRERFGDIPTTKEVYRNFIQIALPSIIEMVLMSLVSSVDTMMVGELGPAAIAAVGLTGQPRMLMLTFFFAINIGVTSIVSRRKGENRREEANHTLRNALILISFLSIFIMIFALIFSRPLMMLARAEEDTIENAELYFRILMLGLPLNAITMCINAAQRGVGNARTTLYINMTSNIVNVVFNFLLITGRFGFPRLEVAGAAISTIFGFFCGFIFCLLSIFPKKKAREFLHLSFRDNWHLKKSVIRPVFKVGSSAMLEQVFIRIGFLTYAGIVADLGTNTFAAHQIVMQFTSISFTFGDGIAVAGTSMVGQMLGKKRSDLSFLYGRVGQRIAFCVSFFLFFVIFLLRFQLTGLFTNELEVLNLAANALVVVAVFQPFQTSSVVMSGCLRGAGDTRYVAFIMIICVCLLRPLLSLLYIHVFHLGLVGAWLASLTDMIIRMTCVYIRFSSGKWTKIKV